jgi:heat shock protein HslJ
MKNHTKNKSLHTPINNQKYFCLLFFTLLIMSCNTPVNEQVLWINSSKVDCVGVGPMKCMQVKNTESEAWSNFYQGIKGFEFEPGYRYKLKVVITTLDKSSLPADTSSLSYELIEILSKEKDPLLLLNDIWVVDTLTGIDNLKEFQLKSLPVLEINTRTMSIMGTDGCNRYRGKLATLDEGSIGFGPIMGTKRLCPEMTIANQYTLALSQVKHFKREGLTLSFLDEQNNLLIGFKKID